MKIGIVGCGLNSDYHISFARTYPDAEIVGVVDKDEEKAERCAAKYSIKWVYGKIEDLVEQQAPDVIQYLAVSGERNTINHDVYHNNHYTYTI